MLFGIFINKEYSNIGDKIYVDLRVAKTQRRWCSVRVSLSPMQS